MRVFTISLTKGLVAIVDEADAERVSALKWTATHSPRLSPRARHYWREGGRVRSIYLHQFIMRPAPGLCVDHINGDGLDNRRANLRVCTQAENNRNRPACSAVGFKGVTPSGARFLAQITSNKQARYLGTFDTPEEAARAYDIAARETHGPFARLNFEEPVFA